MEQVRQLEAEFEVCRKILTAFGDEVRQRILMLMVTGRRSGMRVSEIAEQTELTRPAISHHMQILKDSGIVMSRKEGKLVYYYLDTSCRNVEALLRLFESVRSIIQSGEAYV
ncbi:MAG: ArsR/SmtB family transcription factor [Candidatus Spyradocola sp.]